MNQSFYPGEDLASHFPLKAALSIFFLALVHHAFMFLCFPCWCWQTCCPAGLPSAPLCSGPKGNRRPLCFP